MTTEAERGVDEIVLDEVTCAGTEKSLFDCKYQTNHNCAHSEDVAVDCLTDIEARG